MSLLDEYSNKFVMVTKTSTDDGEGGTITSWTEGSEFSMPMEHDTTIEARISEKEGTASTYIFYPPKDMVFKYHDVFKRTSDNTYFRVTSPSSEKYTPDSSGLNLTMVIAERWELTS